MAIDDHHTRARPAELSSPAGGGGEIAAASAAPLGASTNSPTAAVERLGSCAGPLTAIMLQGVDDDDGEGGGGGGGAVDGDAVGGSTATAAALGDGSSALLTTKSTAADLRHTTEALLLAATAVPAASLATGTASPSSAPNTPVAAPAAAATAAAAAAAPVITPALARGDLQRLPLFIQTSVLTANVRVVRCGLLGEGVTVSRLRLDWLLPGVDCPTPNTQPWYHINNPTNPTHLNPH